MKIKSFPEIFNEHIRFLEKKLCKPARSNYEYSLNLDFLGGQLVQTSFFKDERVYEYTLRALELANNEPPLFDFNANTLFRTRQIAIYGFSLLHLIRGEISAPYFVGYYDPEDDSPDAERLLTALNKIKFQGKELILTLARIDDVAKGDRIMLREMCLR